MVLGTPSCLTFKYGDLHTVLTNNLVWCLAHYHARELDMVSCTLS